MGCFALLSHDQHPAIWCARKMSSAGQFPLWYHHTRSDNSVRLLTYGVAVVEQGRRDGKNRVVFRQRERVEVAEPHPEVRVLRQVLHVRRAARQIERAQHVLTQPHALVSLEGVQHVTEEHTGDS